MTQQYLAKPVLEKLTTELLDSNKEGISLGLLYLGDNPVIESFVSRKIRFAEKVGIPLELVQIQNEELEKLSFEDIKVIIQELAEKHSGIVIQLPLANKFQEQEQEILDLVPVTHDVDVLSTKALELFSQNELPFIPAVAGSISELASFYGVSFIGKKVALVGSGKLVGLPVSKMLDLSKIEYKTFVKGDSLDSLKEFDIIISGAGVSGLIQLGHVTEKTVVFDAGTSEKGRVIAGDLDGTCFDFVAAYSPVPGGIGPLTIAVLFKNLVATKKVV
jgi:5,10-methylene-tetrahydrofolate dehydrogenase/methenyl tetrahydrofolate cyclohydrolase